VQISGATQTDKYKDNENIAFSNSAF